MRLELLVVPSGREHRHHHRAAAFQVQTGPIPHPTPDVLDGSLKERRQKRIASARRRPLTGRCAKHQLTDRRAARPCVLCRLLSFAHCPLLLMDHTVQSTHSTMDCQVHTRVSLIMVKAHAPATAKGRAMRERIVQAAAELVAEKGVAGVSLDDVRARTGASRSQLYHYFEDRDDLVRTVVDVTTDAVIDFQGDLLHHLDTWAGIDRWFDALVQLQVDRQAAGGCPIGSLAGQLAEQDASARAAIAAGLERWEAHLRDGLI